VPPTAIMAGVAWTTRRVWRNGLAKFKPTPERSDQLPLDHGLYRSVSTVRAATGSAAGTAIFAVVAVTGNAHLAGGIIAAILLLATWRMWTAGVRTEHSGVKIVGFLVTKRVAWDDIDHFAVLPLGRYPWVGHVLLRDGRDLPCLAISAASRPRTERRRLQVQRPIDALNAQLAKAREMRSA